MPKLRNASTDLGKFAQWLGRKCRNHHPLEELALNTRGGVFLKKAGERKQVGSAEHPNQYQAKSKGQVFVLAEDESVILYEAGGRSFEITVKEVEPETHAHKERVPVGY